jgi:hypothetical protein
MVQKMRDWPSNITRITLESPAIAPSLMSDANQLEPGVVGGDGD